MKDDIKKLAQELKDELITIRRYLHQNPELSLKEYNTSKFIYDKLKEFGIEEVYNDIYETAVMAIIRGKVDGKTILLRADIDALPIIENTNCEYKSKNNGVMHACGHDSHITWMLGVACVLNKLKNNLTGNIKILFQPAEEAATGAKDLLEKRDILNEEPKVDYAIAGHIWPSLSSGEFGIVQGSAMAAANQFIIEVEGKGGHGAEPHNAIDPIAIANQIYMSAQQIVSRKISPFSNGVLTIGKFIGDGFYNVIPSKVLMEGTIRGQSLLEVKKYTKMLEDLSKGIAECQGAKCNFEYYNRIEAVVNNKILIDKVNTYFKNDEYNIKYLSHGSMTGEDFCYISNKVPSLFIYVGTRNEEKELIYQLHNPKFNLDDDILVNSVQFFSELTINLLNDK